MRRSKLNTRTTGSLIDWSQRFRASSQTTFIMAITAGLFFFTACSQPKAESAKGPEVKREEAVPVAIAVAGKKNVPLTLSAIGTVEASASVNVKSQVEGELIGVHFQEGDEVKAGDLLFTIDQRPYNAQLKQAEATLAKDRAQLDNARKQAARYSGLVGKGGVAQDEYDTALTTVSTLEAGIRSDEAAVENARLKVGYCTIRSPIDGVTGSLKIDRGNIIKANDSEKPLVTIHQIRPIRAVFSLPEQNLPVVRRKMTEGRLDVLAIFQDSTEKPEKGTLIFIENTVDPSTGSILLKAKFDNKTERLWPGQYVNVVLTLGTLSDAVVVPAQAVQTGQQGDYVYLLKEDQTVEFKIVTVDRIVENEAVIRSGVVPGQTVVTDGQLRLTPGAKVKVSAEPGKAGGKPAESGDKKS
jgi:membrane fusion protein, multidrug efflux system